MSTSELLAAVGHSRVEVIRQDRRSQPAPDAARDAVGHHSFEPQPDFDPAPMVFRHQQQQNATVRRLVSDSPFMKQVVGELLDRLVLERLDRHDKELRLRPLLQLQTQRIGLIGSLRATGRARNR